MNTTAATTTAATTHSPADTILAFENSAIVYREGGMTFTAMEVR